MCEWMTWQKDLPRKRKSYHFICASSFVFLLRTSWFSDVRCVQLINFMDNNNILLFPERESETSRKIESLNVTVGRTYVLHFSRCMKKRVLLIHSLFIACMYMYAHHVQRAGER
jgi:hypothetical protein